MFHVPDLDAKFLAALGEIDAECGRKVQQGGCATCGGHLDLASYPRKARGELGEAACAYVSRLSYCCRNDGCRKRATPPSLRFLGRKVYFAVLVVLASVAGRSMTLTGRGCMKRVHEVPVRTVRRWLAWWETVFALSAFWIEAKGLFATAVTEQELPGSLLQRFGGMQVAALEKMLRFTAPITTQSVRARIAMVP